MRAPRALVAAEEPPGDPAGRQPTPLVCESNTIQPKERAMQIEGMTWHGLTLEPDQFVATKKLCREVFGSRR